MDKFKQYFLFWLLMLTTLACSTAFSHPFCDAYVTPINFDSYDTLVMNTSDIAGTLTITCQSPRHRICYTIKINQGTSGNFNGRQMANNTERLGYNLYLDHNRTVIWGDGNGDTSYIKDFIVTNGKNNPITRTYTIYGRLPALQDVPSGNYLDSLQINIDYDVRGRSSACPY